MNEQALNKYRKVLARLGLLHDRFLDDVFAVLAEFNDPITKETVVKMVVRQGLVLSERWGFDFDVILTGERAARNQEKASLL